jgi:hypothetical protein
MVPSVCVEFSGLHRSLSSHVVYLVRHGLKGFGPNIGPGKLSPPLRSFFAGLTEPQIREMIRHECDRRARARISSWWHCAEADQAGADSEHFLPFPEMKDAIKSHTFTAVKIDAVIAKRPIIRIKPDAEPRPRDESAGPWPAPSQQRQ